MNWERPRVQSPKNPEQREAMARGQKEAYAVRTYLNSLGGRGNPFTKSETIQKRIEELNERISEESDTIRRLELIDKRLELEGRSASLDAKEGFLKYAASFSKRKGISPEAWCEMGVTKKVLKEAGIL